MAAIKGVLMNSSVTNPIPWLSRPARISFALMAVLLVVVGWLHMTTLLLTTLFASLALRKLSLGRSKVVGVILFIILLSVCSWATWHYGILVYKSFPRIAETTIPARIAAGVAIESSRLSRTGT